MGYGGVIGCVAESFVLSVTEHHNFWSTENRNKKKTGKLYSLWNVLM